METCQLLIKENLETHGKNLEILQKVVRFYFSIGGAMNTDFALFVVHVVTTKDGRKKKMDENYSKGSFLTDKPTNHGQNVRQSPNKV